MQDEGNCALLHEQAGEEPHQRALHPPFAENDKQDECQQIDGCHNTECRGMPNVGCQGLGGRKREVDEHDDEQQKEHCRNDERRDEAHNLINYIELHKFTLKPDVMFQHFD